MHLNLAFDAVMGDLTVDFPGLDEPLGDHVDGLTLSYYPKSGGVVRCRLTTDTFELWLEDSPEDPSGIALVKKSEERWTLRFLPDQ